MHLPESITVEKIGNIDKFGKSIIYIKENESVISTYIPRVPIGTKLNLMEDGYYHIDFSEITSETDKTLLKISEEFYFATKDIIKYQDYIYLTKIFSYSCMDLFKENPYFLTECTREDSDMPIASFMDVDRNITLDTFEKRKHEIKALVSYILSQNECTGSTYMFYSELEKKALFILEKNGHKLQQGTIAHFIKYYNDTFILKEGKVAFYTNYAKENHIYSAIKTLTTARPAITNYDPVIPENADEGQKKAIKYLIPSGGNLCILSGGPGTGKTTIIKHIIKGCKDLNENEIYLLATTGKAAKRISEQFREDDFHIGISTIHKFIGFGHVLNKYELNAIKKAKIIFIDESSMLEMETFDRFLTLIDPASTKVILVGDIHQLPSIGAGNILHDLIKLGVQTFYLTINHRSNAMIDTNANNINKGITTLFTDKTFKIINLPVKIQEDMIKKGEQDIVISPYKKEDKICSTSTLNKLIQNEIFKDIPNSNPFSPFRIGDIIIMTRTNYKVGYINGETGTIIKRYPNNALEVAFEDKCLTIKNEEDMELAYAVTVHKAQGSEWDDVTICIPEFSKFITRRMLYTALTRTKKSVKIYSSKAVLKQVIENNPEEVRNTFLSEKPRII